MKKIEEYILESKKMNNSSDGGSPAYHFQDGVVLIQYCIPKKYNEIPRKNEEQIAMVANEKNYKGVKTPKHLAIKRTEEEDNIICYVLQERAKGTIYSEYSVYKNARLQLEKQSIIYNMPFNHYIKCIEDICELFNMGLELKPKNIFYDKNSKNGGFTFIDLLSYDKNPLNPNSIKDMLLLIKYMEYIFIVPTIKSYDKSATIVEYYKSQQLYFRTMQKVLIAMEKIFPNFHQQKRWILRSLPQNMIDFFKKRNIIEEDLDLTEQEYLTFDKNIGIIVDNSIEKIASGNYLYWQIMINEIRLELEEWGLNNAWVYHKENELRRIDYEDDYEFKMACKRDLEKRVCEMFERKLTSISAEFKNKYILQAQEDMKINQTKRKNNQNTPVM